MASVAEKRLFLGQGSDEVFLRQVAAFIAHPLATADSLVREDYANLLDFAERNIFAALAIHCGKPQVAKQMMTDHLDTALQAPDKRGKQRDHGCLLGYVSPVVTEHVNFLCRTVAELSIEKPARDCSCQCSATISKLRN